MQRFQVYLLGFCLIGILGMNGKIIKPTTTPLNNDQTTLFVLKNLLFVNSSMGIMTAVNGSTEILTAENDVRVSWSNVSFQGVLAVQGLRLTLGVTASAVNTLLLVTLIRFDVLHSPGNVIAGALAIADASHGVSKLLVMVTDEPYGLQLSGLCHFQTALGLTGQLGNIGFTLAMTIHRFIAIKYPLRYTGLVTTRGTFRAMALCWAFILIIVSVQIILDFNSGDPQLEPGSGYRCWSYRYTVKSIFTTLTHPLYFASLIVSSIIYAWIKVIARRHERQIQDSQCQNAQTMVPPMGRANRTIFKVLVLYALTTMPIIVLDICFPHSETDLAVTAKGLLRYLLAALWFSNSYLNTIVYSLSNDMFREKMKATLMCRQN